MSFLSPLQANLALTYHTKSGWAVNPRIRYNIGYPIGGGNLTAAVVNGVAMNVPNTNVLQLGAAQQGGLPPAYYADPMYPGSITNPNVVATSGYTQKSSPGGNLTAPSSTTAITIYHYSARSRLSWGVDIENLFNELYTGAFYNSRYQPLATGISGPLTGYSLNAVDFGANGVPQPYALPRYGSILGGPNAFLDAPNGIGRSVTLFANLRL